MYKTDYNPASKEELMFIRRNMPRGMVTMIQVRTGLKRTQVLYQLLYMPENQNREVIQAAREIFHAVTDSKTVSKEGFIPASHNEILFIRKNMPKGMVAMIQARTGLNRTQVLYQINQMPGNQNREVIQAAREILYAVTGLSYHDEDTNMQALPAISQNGINEH